MSIGYPKRLRARPTRLPTIAHIGQMACRGLSQVRYLEGGSHGGRAEMGKAPQRGECFVLTDCEMWYNSEVRMGPPFPHHVKRDCPKEGPLWGASTIMEVQVWQKIPRSRKI
jgi:hypothetical protein